MRDYLPMPVHILLLTQALLTHAKTLNVTWTRPVQGTIYTPGHFVIGEWTASKAVISPSFKLCMLPASQSPRRANAAAKSDCGQAMWPRVEQASGSYVVSLKVPDVTATEVGMFLEMKDDFGATARSPDFTLSPQEPNPPSASAQDAPPESDIPASSSTSSSPTSRTTKTKSKSKSDASSPMTAAAVTTATGKHSSVTHTKSHSQSLSGKHAVTASASASAIAIAGAVAPQVTSPSPVSGPSSSSPVPSSPSPVPLTPNLTATRSPAPTVALAIPLSLIGLVVLASALLAVHHHRSLVTARKQEGERLSGINALSYGQEGSGSARVKETWKEKDGDLDDIISLYSTSTPARGNERRRTFSPHSAEHFHTIPLSPCSPTSVITSYFPRVSSPPPGMSSPPRTSFAAGQHTPPTIPEALHVRRPTARRAEGTDQALPRRPDLYEAVAKVIDGGRRGG
ncbi:hypothetical protein BV22DRAFT_835345 [Leucogyrophana mollusca]|uniref:Uncharacterized protein n=1 Tax=Leucogyrophana mollusca TaxID=85980 RepID=A0ACB8B523_9AGAM|nr:hypothetical protein BV22DRAFT_835345 [Leucogyrophana mollusca]